ncbi:T9SS C-terminal target domain-containing protein [Lacihabitans sp. LS3-19]|uniref:M1 family aminopeptidase n=1 Tax=Lacihabitans sp. LS3-19 TaxID=2487335 RepID=UPI0020CF84D8|nr:M1 family aminopeptidase [Lacihabitans sp. LS3-19]MCP9768220.1 T9SS C-terminal target domain-containing protein [Lacihabitans sp. LS3-19]
MKYFALILLFTISAKSQTLNGEACSLAKKKAFIYNKENARFAYPGDQNIDIKYHLLKLNIDYTNKFLNGSVFTTLKALTDISTCSFDLNSPMKVDSVIWNKNKLTFSQTSKQVNITFKNTLKKDEILSLEIFYKGNPRTSTFGSFSVSTHGAAKSPVVWTLSESYGGPDWWPCKDDPSDKIDSSEVWITLPSSFVSVSNGVQKGLINNQNNTKTYQWKNSHPISHYLISIACSNYQLYENSFVYNGKTMPVSHYIYPETLTTNVKKLLDETTAMLQFFSDTFGEYPFIDEKYGHAMCNFGGGMEHQTVSSMGGFSVDLISHELAHQWFGDKITCKTWADIFMNEAFASYSEALYEEHKNGRAAYYTPILDHMARAKKTTEPIFISDPTNENLIFDYALTYGKGAVVLHMLRGVLGDEAFFKSLKDFQNSEYAYGAASIDDFRKFLEKNTSTDLKYFFDEWIYGVNYPKYTFSYKQLGDQSVGVEISQEKLSSNPSFFKMPVQFKIVLNSGKELLETRFVDEQTKTFTFENIPETVKDIQFDPDNFIMKELLDLGEVTSITNTSENEIMIYPNPGMETIEIKEIPKEVSSIELLNSKGQLINSLEINTKKHNISKLPAGQYILKFSGENYLKSKTFIKN